MKNLIKRTPEELIVLGSAVICLLGLVPFTVYRFSLGHWLVAGIDAVGVALCISAIYQVIRYRQVWLFGGLMSIAAVMGVLGIVFVRGIEDAPFLYPVIILSYFLLKPFRALLLSGIAIAGLAVILADQVSIFYLSKILLSVLACSLFAFIFASMRNLQNDRLTLLSTRDPLTSVLNRRSLDERLKHFVGQPRRQQQAAVLIILDLDNFKLINDRDGHVVGDEVLARVAKTLAQRIRASDQLYRFGGDEFVVFVADASLEQSLGLAEDLRSRVEATEAMEGTMLSISLGVAAYESGESAKKWLDRADTGLLQAKRSGRNSVGSKAVA